MIEAMKQALEALESHGSPWLHHEKQYTDAIASLRQAIEKAEKQEPVCDTDPRGCWSVRCQLGNKCKNTPAPQREWVGLTDEEMLECNMDGDFMINRETSKRNVEAKLKEKNT